MARCRTDADVGAALAYARAEGLDVAPRSGGHCFAGRSSTEGVVIDVSPMSSVSLDGEVATIGAGARLGNVYDALARDGRTLAAGCGPEVGIAGLTLGGGLGILGRLHGLTADTLLAARVVLADGSAVEASERSEPDLFWALRGSAEGSSGSSPRSPCGRCRRRRSPRASTSSGPTSTPMRCWRPGRSGRPTRPMRWLRACS